jgi:hypothetical protein
MIVFHQGMPYKPFSLGKVPFIDVCCSTLILSIQVFYLDVFQLLFELNHKQFCTKLCQCKYSLKWHLQHAIGNFLQKYFQNF